MIGRVGLKATAHAESVWPDSSAVCSKGICDQIK
jgi:hypothetical protein